jgi:hypothetical protein
VAEENTGKIDVVGKIAAPPADDPAVGVDGGKTGVVGASVRQAVGHTAQYRCGNLLAGRAEKRDEPAHSGLGTDGMLD